VSGERPSLQTAVKWQPIVFPNIKLRPFCVCPLNAHQLDVPLLLANVGSSMKSMKRGVLARPPLLWSPGLGAERLRQFRSAWRGCEPASRSEILEPQKVEVLNSCRRYPLAAVVIHRDVFKRRPKGYSPYSSMSDSTQCSSRRYPLTTAHRYSWSRSQGCRRHSGAPRSTRDCCRLPWCPWAA
jgi:hypothetical protein